MQIVSKSSALMIAAIGFAGCDGPTTPFAFGTTYTTFTDIETAFQAPTDALVDTDGTLVDTGDISQGTDFDVLADGTAIYDGAIIASETDTGDTLIGQLQIEVAFATDSMDGRAGNFIHETDGALTGTLLGNSTLVRTVDVDLEENHFTMALTGALSANGEGYDTTINLEGNFLNGVSDIESVAGDADVDLGTGAAAYDEGAFAATR